MRATAFDDRHGPPAVSAGQAPAWVAAFGWGQLAVANGSLFAVAVYLIERRSLGQLSQPLSLSQLLLASAVLAVLGRGLRAVHRQLVRARWELPDSPALAVVQQALAWVPTGTVALAGIALTHPGGSAVGLIVFWLVLLSSEATGLYHRGSSGTLAAARPRGEPAGETASEAPSTDLEPTAGNLGAGDFGCDEELSCDEELNCDEDDGEAILPDEVSQQLTRSQPATGGELVEGFLRAEVAEGDRQQLVHVAFCPPLASPPRVDLLQLDGPPATLTVAECEVYGVRIEARLAQPAAAPTNLLLHLRAHCP